MAPSGRGNQPADLGPTSEAREAVQVYMYLPQAWGVLASASKVMAR